MFAPVLVGAVIAALACAFLVRWGRESARRYGQEMPQRFHAGDVPRMGGAAMMLACTAAWGVMALIQAGSDSLVGPVWAASMLMAGAGLAEDVTHRMAVRWRLGLTLLGAVLAVWALGLHIGPLGLSWLEPLWTAAPWIGTLLAVVAVAGLPHAFNLIDGYNGLAGVVAVIYCVVLASVAWQVGDGATATLVLALAGASLGFLVWNYPRGLMFAGDGGAYLWGAVLAIAVVRLVQRHPDVSPWFAALLLLYPVFETLFSIYRKLARGQSPGHADALHLHQLMYRRLVRPVPPGPQALDEAARMRARNNRTSPYLWGLAMLSAVPAALFWSRTPVLMALCALFIALYLGLYLRIVHWRAPRWLRR